MAVTALLTIRTATNSTNFQQNTNRKKSKYQQPAIPTELDKNLNERFTWNMEYKPDTINYLKITPTFTYATTRSRDDESNNLKYLENPD